MNRYPAILRTLLALAWVVCPVAWAEPSDTLMLRDEAFVAGPKITLGDVAEIKGMNAVRLADIELSVAPPPGDSRSINAALVSSRLRSAGIDLAAVEIKGADNVKATRLKAEVESNFIADSLHAYIVEHMPWDAANTEIEISSPGQTVVVPEGPAEVAWETSPQYRFLGPGTFRGTLYVDGQRQKTVMCSAKIVAYGEVVVASRDVPRGRPIGPLDIEARKVPLDETIQGTLIGQNDVIGLLSSRTLFPGDVITTRNTQLPLAVRRNQMVPIELKAGTLQVRSQARAITDGSVGDTVRCVNDQTKEELQGVIRADGVVVMN